MYILENKNNKTLFSRERVNILKERRKEKIREEVERLSLKEIESDQDLRNLILIFNEKYKFNLLEIYSDEKSKREGENFKVDVSNYSSFFTTRSPHYKTANSVKISIPFKGSKSLLNYTPTTYTSVRPKCEKVSREAIQFKLGYFPKSDESEKIAEEINKKIKHKIERFEKYIGFLNHDLENINEELKEFIANILLEKYKSLKTEKEVLTKIDAQKAGEKSDVNYLNPEKKIKINLKKYEDKGEKCHLLSDNVFSALIEIIYSMGLSLERSSENVRNLDEEPLRDIFLSAINTHFNGLATGETFNKKGKTDILFRYQNENLFIAEFKFWRGKEHCWDGIDQLLANLTFRDSQAGLIFFSRKTNYKETRNKFKKAVCEHEKFKKRAEINNETIFLFKKEDGNIIKVAAQIFDLH